MRLPHFYLALCLLCINLYSHADPTSSRSAKQSIELDQCAFAAPMKDGFSLRLTESSSPRLANFRGRFLKGKSRHIGEIWIQFVCEELTPDNLLENAWMKNDSGRWALGRKDQSSSLLNTHFIPLKGLNWEGGGVLQDQAAVKLPQRARDYSFCMVHPPVALCGTAHDVQYLAYPKENVLPHVLKFLQSIEFVNNTK